MYVCMQLYLLLAYSVSYPQRFLESSHLQYIRSDLTADNYTWTPDVVNEYIWMDFNSFFCTDEMHHVWEWILRMDESVDRYIFSIIFERSPIRSSDRADILWNNTRASWADQKEIIEAKYECTMYAT